MSILIQNLANKINFRGSSEETNLQTEVVKSDFERAPQQDEIIKEDTSPEKKAGLVKKVFVGLISTIAIIYGSIVLKRKLSKPTFAQVKEALNEIFQKDFTDSQAKEILEKYKQICKSNDTDDFVKKIVDETKHNYELDSVQTSLKIEKLKDSKIKTAMEQTEYGSASPLGDIVIRPNTHSKNIIRSVQSETFDTAFHELKHLRQFLEIYRTAPDKLAEVFYEATLKNDPKAVEEAIQKTIEANKKAGIAVSKDKAKELVKKATMEETVKKLDAKYGHLPKYAKDSPEYKKGLEYLESYKNYPDRNTSYEDYKNNLLEKEAFRNGDLGRKIYKYVSSIWKL